MGFLTKCPISVEDKPGALSAETGRSLLQAFNTSTSVEFMARLVCKSRGGGRERGAAAVVVMVMGVFNGGDRRGGTVITVSVRREEVPEAGGEEQS